MCGLEDELERCVYDYAVGDLVLYNETIGLIIKCFKKAQCIYVVHWPNDEYITDPWFWYELIPVHDHAAYKKKLSERCAILGGTASENIRFQRKIEEARAKKWHALTKELEFNDLSDLNTQKYRSFRAFSRKHAAISRRLRSFQ